MALEPMLPMFSSFDSLPSKFLANRPFAYEEEPRHDIILTTLASLRADPNSSSCTKTSSLFSPSSFPSLVSILNSPVLQHEQDDGRHSPTDQTDSSDGSHYSTPASSPLLSHEEGATGQCRRMKTANYFRSTGSAFSCVNNNNSNNQAQDQRTIKRHSPRASSRTNTPTANSLETNTALSSNARIPLQLHSGLPFIPVATASAAADSYIFADHPLVLPLASVHGKYPSAAGIPIFPGAPWLCYPQVEDISPERQGKRKRDSYPTILSQHDDRAEEISNSNNNCSDHKLKRKKKERGQLETLENVFKATPLPTKKMKERLSVELGLSLRAVQVTIAPPKQQRLAFTFLCKVYTCTCSYQSSFTDMVSKQKGKGEEETAKGTTAARR